MKEKEIKRDITKNLVKSIKEFDFFTNYVVDLQTFEMFKLIFKMDFDSRNQPDIYYRNFFITAMYKKTPNLSLISKRLEINHATLSNAIQKSCWYIQSNDKHMKEIFNHVKFFFEQYVVIERQEKDIYSKEFISSMELERRFFFTGLLKTN